MKKWVAIFLALVMVMAFDMNVFAADYKVAGVVDLTNPIGETNYTHQLNRSFDIQFCGEKWNGCSVLRAGNGKAEAFSDFNLGGKYNALTFRVTPQGTLDDVFGFCSYTRATNVKISVINLDTNTVITEKTINEDQIVTTFLADVTGCNNIRIYAELQDGSLGYVLMKDAILWTF